ncbi:MAG TPA: anhydro-N-acetylmuramic acid kinase [Acidisarcina sp.]
MPLKNMIVAGIMSGTSADGIDVALVRIGRQRGQEALGVGHFQIKLLRHVAIPYSASLRRAVLRAMDAEPTTTAELARLNWRLGIAYAEAVQAALEAHPCRLQLIGCHGQTIYHQGIPAAYAGRKIACTWQIGEMAALAAATRVSVVSNFRPADMVAGGQGAPLVPLLDFVYFRHAVRGRVLQNIGGIGNFTAIPPGAALKDVRAMDTGPGNMIIDAAMQKLFNKPYDRGGRVASRGHVLVPVLNEALRHPFFRKQPPRSAGREQFGAAFSAQFLASCARTSPAPEDAVATATALTAHSIADAYTRFVRPSMKQGPVDYFLSGGGARNATLTGMLSALLTPLGCEIRSTGDAGMPAQAKEAVAFALLAYQTMHELPGNVPSATGASRAAILGQITYA